MIEHSIQADNEMAVMIAGLVALFILAVSSYELVAMAIRFLWRHRPWRKRTRPTKPLTTRQIVKRLCECGELWSVERLAYFHIRLKAMSDATVLVSWIRSIPGAKRKIARRYVAVCRATGVDPLAILPGEFDDEPETGIVIDYYKFEHEKGEDHGAFQMRLKPIGGEWITMDLAIPMHKADSAVAMHSYQGMPLDWNPWPKEDAQAMVPKAELEEAKAATNSYYETMIVAQKRAERLTGELNKAKHDIRRLNETIDDISPYVANHKERIRQAKIDALEDYLARLCTAYEANGWQHDKMSLKEIALNEILVKRIDALKQQREDEGKREHTVEPGTHPCTSCAKCKNGVCYAIAGTLNSAEGTCTAHTPR